MHPSDQTCNRLAARLAEAVGRLGDLDVEQVKAELTRDARSLAADIAPMLLGLPLIGLAWVFANLAAALALAPVAGAAGAFAVMSSANLVIGAIGVRMTLSQLRRRRILPSREDRTARQRFVGAMSGARLSACPVRAGLSSGQ